MELEHRREDVMAENVGGHTPLSPRQQLIIRFVELSNDVSSQMRPGTSEEWSDIELTMHQFRALSMLGRGPLRIGDLASYLGVRLSSVTNLVHRLENKGLLERIPDLEDRRVVWCRLTLRGRQETENLWKTNRQLLKSVAAHLTDADLLTVVETFEVLSSALAHKSLEGYPSTLV